MSNRLYNLKNSFAYAIGGIAFCVRYERNMRIHITAFVYVMYFALYFYDFTRAELLLLILTCVLVMSLEIVNTAIEVLTDKASPEYSSLGKAAKDTAAGAVLIAAAAAFIVGVILFWDLEKLKGIGSFFTENIFAALALLSSLGLSVMFIFSGKQRRKRGKVTAKQADAAEESPVAERNEE